MVMMNFQLDDWVLCRIYKKSSSSQKTTVMSGGIVSSKEHSHASSSSSSSLDDMLESLPGIEDQFFAVPRMNSSLKVEQQPHEEKPSLQSLGSSGFDWAALAGLGSGPELNHARLQQQVFNYGNNNDAYVPAFPPALGTNQWRLGSSMVDEEVQSGLRGHQQGSGSGSGSGSGWLTQSLTSSIDPFVSRYPGFGFRQ